MDTNNWQKVKQKKNTKAGSKKTSKKPAEPQPNSHDPVESTIYAQAERLQTAKKEKNQQAETQVPIAIKDVKPVQRKDKKRRKPQSKTKPPSGSWKKLEDISECSDVLKSLDVDVLEAAKLQAQEHTSSRERQFDMVVGTFVDQLKALPTLKQNHDYITVIDDSIMSFFNELMNNCSTDELHAVFARYLVTCVDQSQKGDSIGAIQITLLLMLNYEQTSADSKKLSMLRAGVTKIHKIFHETFPEPKVMLPIFWITNSVATRLPSSYLTVFAHLMFPALCDENASTSVKEYAIRGLEKLQKQEKELKKKKLAFDIASSTFFQIFLACYRLKKFNLSDEHLKLITKFYPVYRHNALRSANNSLELFKLLIQAYGQKLPKQAENEIHRLLVQCLERHQVCCEALSGQFKKHSRAIMLLLYRMYVSNAHIHKAFKGKDSAFQKALASIDRKIQDPAKSSSSEKEQNISRQWKDLIQDMQKQKKVRTKSGSNAILPSWFLWILLLVSTGLFMLLTSHFVCRFQLEEISAAKEPCQTLEHQGILAGVDKFYESLKPIEPHLLWAWSYVNVAIGVVEPYWSATFLIAKPYLTSIYNYVVEFWNQLQPILQSALTQITPVISQGIEYCKPILITIVEQLTIGWDWAGAHIWPEVVKMYHVVADKIIEFLA